MTKTPVQPEARADRTAIFEAKRMDILRKAALAFAKDGYHQTSVSSLATRIGVSKPVLYYYAKNKDDLLYQCGDIARVQLRDAIDDALKLKISGLGQLRRFFSAYTEIMCGDFGRCLALVDPIALSDEARNKDAQTRRGLEDAVRKMLNDGQADGSVRQCDTVLAARAIFGAFNGIPRWYHVGGALAPADVSDGYLDLFVNGVGRIGHASP